MQVILQIREMPKLSFFGTGRRKTPKNPRGPRVTLFVMVSVQDFNLGPNLTGQELLNFFFAPVTRGVKHGPGTNFGAKLSFRLTYNDS